MGQGRAGHEYVARSTNRWWQKSFLRIGPSPFGALYSEGKQPLFSSPNGHDFRTFRMQTPRTRGLISEVTMPTAKVHALTILGAFDAARSELVGKEVRC
jgi:hypothetical protein